MSILFQNLKSIKLRGRIRWNFPMAELSSFKTGGSADIATWPESTEELLALVHAARAQNLPWIVLGGGSNILISDRGIRGMVILTTEMNDIRREGQRVIAAPGAPMSEVSARAANWGLAGLDFIYAMPGSSGGAVWMNARCYGSEIADVLEWTEYIDIDADPLEVKRLAIHADDFSYKRSPFQRNRNIILESSYLLTLGKREELWKKMREHEDDRTRKGHFLAPCAGSIFKNNRSFGAPSGKIIDSLKMRGTRIGGAKVSDLHANIIINENTASAAEIARLIHLIHERVLEELGFDLEPEVIKIGQWS